MRWSMIRRKRVIVRRSRAPWMAEISSKVRVSHHRETTFAFLKSSNRPRRVGTSASSGVWPCFFFETHAADCGRVFCAAAQSSRSLNPPIECGGLTLRLRLCAGLRLCFSLLTMVACSARHAAWNSQSVSRMSCLMSCRVVIAGISLFDETAAIPQLMFGCQAATCLAQHISSSCADG